MPKETPDEKAARKAEGLNVSMEAPKKAESETSESKGADKEPEDKAGSDQNPEAESIETKPESATIMLRGVVLRGSAAQMKGNHSIHLNAMTNVNFVSGKANVSESIAAQLKDAGFIE